MPRITNGSSAFIGSSRSVGGQIPGAPGWCGRPGDQAHDGQIGAVPLGAVSLPPWIWARKKHVTWEAGAPEWKFSGGARPFSVSFLGSAYRAVNMSAAVGLAGRLAAAAPNSTPPVQPDIGFGPSAVLASYLAIACANWVTAGVLANHSALVVGT